MRAIALGLAMALTGCSNLTENGSVIAGGEPVFRLMAGDAIYMMLAPPDLDADGFLTAARRQCEGKSACQVLAWTDATNAATAMPMMGREVDALMFSYSLNRDQDHERALWRCDVYPRDDRNECIPPRDGPDDTAGQ